MVRPVDADSVATFEQIVTAALEELAECKTPADLSMRKVAERAGLSKSAIHYYFGSRVELLEACLDGYYERLSTMALRNLDLVRGASSGRDVIELCTRAVIRFVRAEKPLVALRLSLNAELGELHPRRQERFLRDQIKQAADQLAHFVKVPVDEMRLAIQAVGSIIVRFVMMQPNELELVTGQSGKAAVDAADDFIVRAACRIVLPNGT